MKKTGLPTRVFEKGRWFYLVRAAGSKRVWEKLSPVRDGLPGVYGALSRLFADDALRDRMPGLIARWEAEVMPRHAEKTQRDERLMGRSIADGFVEFPNIAAIEPPDIAAYLRPLRDRPRWHNAHRGHLRELMRFAIELGLRPAGSNPVTDIRTMSTPSRKRCPTDSEVRRIKVAACYGDDGKRTRSGPMICALIDMAYLTGQRIGDLLALEWSAVGAEGILFAPAKVAGSTGAAVMIEWTPRLRTVVERLRAMRVLRRGFAPQVFTSIEGTPYTYWGASSAWRRAMARAGVQGLHFHDLRAKALTDVDERRGIGQARTMGAHGTEAQTTAYLRSKRAKRTLATR